MTPFGPLPGMPGGPPWGSVAAINAMAWYQQQQAAAAMSAREMARIESAVQQKAQVERWLLLLLR